MPRLQVRNEVFDVMYDYKHEGLDIGDAYDEIFDLIIKSYYGKRPRQAPISTRKGQIRKTSRRAYTKRKLSGWQKFIKANSKKKKFKFANGKLKLKSMGIAYRKTAAYKRNKKK
jgi:hypothetical protein